MALTFLMWCAMYKKSKLARHKLVSPLLCSILPILAEDETVFDDDDTPPKLAFQVISTLATNLSPNLVWPVVLEWVMKNIHGGQWERKASMMAIGGCVDGCADTMRSNVNGLVEIVSHGLKDNEESVRRAACYALSCLAGKTDISLFCAFYLFVFLTLT